MLTDDSYESLDPAGGQWIARGLLCTIYPCIDGADRVDSESPVEDFIDGNEEGFFHQEYERLAFADVKKMG